MRRSGLALIIVLGVIGVLAILAMAFVTMAQLERKASQQRLGGTKALLLARSGIEDALARLSAGQDPQDISNAYGGEDWQMDGDQGPGSFDRQQEVYDPGVLDLEACPVRQALRPSFFKRDALARPALTEVDGRLRGLSGSLSGDFRKDGNAYSLRISPSSGIYLNGGDPSVASDPTLLSDCNTNLQRMLGILTEAVGRSGGPVA